MPRTVSTALPCVKDDGRLRSVGLASPEGPMDLLCQCHLEISWGAAYACPCKPAAYSDHQSEPPVQGHQHAAMSQAYYWCLPHWPQVNGRATGRRRALNSRGFVLAVGL